MEILAWPQNATHRVPTSPAVDQSTRRSVISLAEGHTIKSRLCPLRDALTTSCPHLVRSALRQLAMDHGLTVTCSHPRLEICARLERPA